MSVTVHTPHLIWARAHRAMLVIALLVVALVATAGLVISRLAADAAPAPATPISTVHGPAFDDHCPQISRPGPTPC